MIKFLNLLTIFIGWVSRNETIKAMFRMVWEEGKIRFNKKQLKFIKNPLKEIDWNKAEGQTFIKKVYLSQKMLDTKLKNKNYVIKTNTLKTCDAFSIELREFMSKQPTYKEEDFVFEKQFIENLTTGNRLFFTSIITDEYKMNGVDIQEKITDIHIS